MWSQSPCTNLKPVDITILLSDCTHTGRKHDNRQPDRQTDRHTYQPITVTHVHQGEGLNIQQPSYHFYSYCSRVMTFITTDISEDYLTTHRTKKEMNLCSTSQNLNIMPLMETCNTRKTLVVGGQKVCMSHSLNSSHNTSNTYRV